ncbi:MAG TPA: glycosyltransferase family 2 protein, partial [Candidatus Bathyarchaeota archaeon]|nr:glycosyltransferase family 2 protein [Candidatus Bathyarchaeota archaeon]
RYDDLIKKGFLKIVRLHKNLGWGGGNIIGLALAKAMRVEYAGFMNDDVMLTQGVLEQLIEEFEKNRHVVVVQPLILYPDGAIQTAGFIVDLFLHNYPLKFAPQRSLPIPQISGAFFIVNIKRLGSIPLFDPILFLYQDDLDVSLKIWISGKSCVLVPSSKVIHLVRRDRLKPGMYYYIVRNTLYLHVVYYPMLVLPFVMVSYVVLRLYEGFKYLMSKGTFDYIKAALLAIHDFLRYMVGRAIKRRIFYEKVLKRHYHYKMLRFALRISKLRVVKWIT